MFMAGDLRAFVPQDLMDLYEVHNFRHAAEVLSTSYRPEFDELLTSLRDFRITLSDITDKGGNESEIPKRISKLLRPRGWFETRIQGDLMVTQTFRDESGPKSVERKIERRIEAFLDGHKVDYVRNGVAFDLEWNAKDQTFDRDLYAFRAFHDCGVIGAAVLVTRSGELNDVFKKLGVMQKYGASTT
jgi:hypothetical protein